MRKPRLNQNQKWYNEVNTLLNSKNKKNISKGITMFHEMLTLVIKARETHQPNAKIMSKLPYLVILLKLNSYENTENKREWKHFESLLEKHISSVITSWNSIWRIVRIWGNESDQLFTANIFVKQIMYGGLATWGFDLVNDFDLTVSLRKRKRT